MSLKRLLPALLAAALLAAAAHADPVQELLHSLQEPPGVVFEIIGSAGFLQQALSGVRTDIARLRARFPGLAVAVVSHGVEQFALLDSRSGGEMRTHALALSLRADDVPVYVCATHAGWRGYTPEDFPAYVEVAASGPAQINDYLALDYVLVVVSD